MRTYRHIIWDWNGTLLDDVWLCVDIINGMLSKRGLYGITHRHYREIFDFPVVKYYEKPVHTYLTIWPILCMYSITVVLPDGA